MTTNHTFKALPALVALTTSESGRTNYGIKVIQQSVMPVITTEDKHEQHGRIYDANRSVDDFYDSPSRWLWLGHR